MHKIASDLLLVQAGNWSLEPTAVLLPPPLESLHCGLPSPEWPSDHISLLAIFQVQKQPESHSKAADPIEELEKQSRPVAQHIRFPGQYLFPNGLADCELPSLKPQSLS